MTQKKLLLVSIISAIGLSGCQSLKPTPVAMNVGDVKGDKNVIIGHVEGDVTVNQGLSREEVEKIVLAYLQANSAKIEAQKIDVAQIKQPIADAVTDLSRQGGAGKSAIKALAQGNEEPAKTVLKQQVQQANVSAKEQADAYRNLGALAFLDNTQEALKNYRRSTELDPDNADGWNELGHLYRRIGELDQAIAAYKTVLRLGQTHQDQEKLAWAYGNLGNIYQTRGELDKALSMQSKALEFDQALDKKEGMASDYNNLGLIYETRGDLDKAVEMYQKSLAISKRLSDKEKMAAAYGNLGNVYYTRGELDKAVDMHSKALDLNQTLGNKEAIARDYSNLGTVYGTRGELNKAVDIYSKALAINQVLGNKEGMARDYGNLGIVYGSHGELDKAVDMNNKALAINQELGIKLAMADNYANLGIVYKQKGNNPKAKRYWQKSFELYKYIGSPHEKEVQNWLDNLK